MHTTQRSFVKVGEIVPVNYVKGECFFLRTYDYIGLKFTWVFTDEKAPVILEDKEYPEWLFSVGKKVRERVSLKEILFQFLIGCVGLNRNWRWVS